MMRDLTRKQRRKRKSTMTMSQLRTTKEKTLTRRKTSWKKRDHIKSSNFIKVDDEEMAGAMHDYGAIDSKDVMTLLAQRNHPTMRMST